MLVLSRKKNETIVVNNDITITVVEIGQGRCRIGVKAKRGIPVNRGEVQDRINEENAIAAEQQPDEPA